MIKKLQSSSGESIAETLVAVLIAALALLMLAGTINSASRMISSSQNNMTKYYQAYNSLADYIKGSERTDLPEGYSGSLTEVAIRVDSSSPSIAETIGDKIPYYEVTGGILGSKKLIAFG